MLHLRQKTKKKESLLYITNKDWGFNLLAYNGGEIMVI
ncbi:hypothetical protein ACZ87_01106 [Candidatus Erwinia dacicola]|uniref:Uncharacterized protein n=1 Tax=Candidatus Erwinia dacicola TaxID=252393 RepID=A0A328TNR5_9GAMM|nr:hypothetical protein ACZ87_01106 [Candidatus Erwinia dacicola]